MSNNDMYARAWDKQPAAKTENVPAPAFSYGGQTASPAASSAIISAMMDDPTISQLMADETVNDILVNGTRSIYVERAGKLQRVNATIPSDAAVLKLAEEIAAQTGKKLNHSRPLLDTRLQDGSRVNIIAPPLAVDGTTISIRKFSKKSITLDMMAVTGNLSSQMAEFLKVCSACKLNILISGGTGSGKTTLLNAISQFIDEDERVVTIEDAAELKLQQPHVIRLETRPYSGGVIDREEEVTMRDLVKNSLRMRPDRIIIGEVRGEEAFDLLQAMNTGHEGSFTTVHANHPRDALSRITNMVNMANLGVPVSAIRGQIASSINLIVQISRMRDGKRRVGFISEIVGMESDVITMQDMFVFKQTGENHLGEIQGNFEWTGIMPRFLRRAHYYNQGDNLSRVLGVKITNN